MLHTGTTQADYEAEATEYAKNHILNPHNALAIVREAMANSQGPDADGSWNIEIPGRYTRDGNPLPFSVCGARF